MKNRLRNISLFIVCFAVLVSVLAACGKKDDGYSQGIFEEDGKLYYREENNGRVQELLTDDNGVTVVDGDGNMIWQFTDANGENATQAVSFPDIIIDGKKVECQQFSLTMPKGWTQKVESAMMIEDSELGVQIDYTYMESTESKVYTVQDVIDNYKKMGEMFDKSLEASVTVDDAEIAGKQAKMVVLKHNEGFIRAYIIEEGGNVMSFLCGGTNFANAEKYDFEKILNTIEFRY